MKVRREMKRLVADTGRLALHEAGALHLLPLIGNFPAAAGRD